MEMISRFLGAAAVLAFFLASVWWLRSRGVAQFRMAGAGRARRMRAVERLALGPQHVLHLVRVDDRLLLVASSPAGCALLESAAWREAPEAGR